MHEGCVAYFSATHLESHEARCAFKLLDCPRGCGAQAQRQHLDAHLEGPCPNKPVTCPLAGLGCEAEGLTQGTLAAHVREAAGDHAVLLAASLGASSDLPRLTPEPGGRRKGPRGDERERAPPPVVAILNSYY